MLNQIKLLYRLYQAKKALELAMVLFGNVNDAVVWMGTKNPALFDFSPIEYIFGGRGNRVIDWLKERA